MTPSPRASSLLYPASLALLLLGAACAEDTAGTADASVRPDASVGPDASVSPDAGDRPDASASPDAASDAPDATATADAGIPRDPACPAAARWVTNVEGSLVDESGAASVGSKAQLCVRTAPNGILTCLRPADSGADGRFTVNVPAMARCIDIATMRFLRPLEDRAVGYCAIDISSGDAIIRVNEAYQLFATTRATTLPPLGDDTTSRTITFASGLELDLVPHDYFPGAGEYAELAATRIAPAAYDACILAGERAFDGMFAFSPEGDIQGRGALRIPNTTGLAANAAVGVYVLGGLGCTLDDGTLVPEGTWARLEGASVSADGTTIAVTPGVPCLTWVAYRAE